MKLKGSQVVRIWEEIQRLKENVDTFGRHHATEDFAAVLTEEILAPQLERETIEIEFGPVEIQFNSHLQLGPCSVKEDDNKSQ